MATEEIKQSKNILNYVYIAGAVLALGTQFVMAVWYFAHMDSRITNLEYTQGHIIERLDLNVPVTNKAENDIIKLQKDDEQTMYRLKIVEVWKDKWTNKAEGLK